MWLFYPAPISYKEIEKHEASKVRKGKAMHLVRDTIILCVALYTSRLTPDVKNRLLT